MKGIHFGGRKEINGMEEDYADVMESPQSSVRIEMEGNNFLKNELMKFLARINI